MLTLRQSRFDLLNRLEQQLQTAERIPAAEVLDTETGFRITLELPGVAKDSIDVKATDRTLVISAQRPAPVQGDHAATALLSEMHYGTWSRSFRFPAGINRDGLEAHYRDGLLTVIAPKARVLVVQRGPGEWWEGLWDFPRVPKAAKTVRRGIEQSEVLSGLACGATSRLGTITHTVTHHRITLDVVACVAGRGGRASSGRRWVTATALTSLAMTSPGRRIARMLE